MSSGASCSTRCRRSSASRSSSRTAAAPAARSALRSSPRPSPTATPCWCMPRRIRRRRPSIRTSSYDAVRDFSAVAALGAVPNVTVISPDKGIKTLKELVAPRQGRVDELRLGRRRQRHAFCRRAAAHQRRLQCRPRAVPRRRIADRGDGRAGRFHVRRDFRRVAVPVVRQAHSAGGVDAEALERAAQCADHAGGGLRQLRLLFLEWHSGAVQDAAAHRRPAAIRRP